MRDRQPSLSPSRQRIIEDGLIMAAARSLEEMGWRLQAARACGVDMSAVGSCPWLPNALLGLSFDTEDIEHGDKAALAARHLRWANRYVRMFVDFTGVIGIHPLTFVEVHAPDLELIDLGEFSGAIRVLVAAEVRARHTQVPA